MLVCDSMCCTCVAEPDHNWPSQKNMFTKCLSRRTTRMAFTRPYLKLQTNSVNQETTTAKSRAYGRMARIYQITAESMSELTKQHCKQKSNADTNLERVMMQVKFWIQICITGLFKFKLLKLQTAARQNPNEFLVPLNAWKTCAIRNGHPKHDKSNSATSHVIG